MGRLGQCDCSHPRSPDGQNHRGAGHGRGREHLDVGYRRQRRLTRQPDADAVDRDRVGGGGVAVSCEGFAQAHSTPFVDSLRLRPVAAGGGVCVPAAYDPEQQHGGILPAEDE